MRVLGIFFSQWIWRWAFFTSFYLTCNIVCLFGWNLAIDFSTTSTCPIVLKFCACVSPMTMQYFGVAECMPPIKRGGGGQGGETHYIPRFRSNLVSGGYEGQGLRFWYRRADIPLHDEGEAVGTCFHASILFKIDIWGFWGPRITTLKSSSWCIHHGEGGQASAYMLRFRPKSISGSFEGQGLPIHGQRSTIFWSQCWLKRIK